MKRKAINRARALCAEIAETAFVLKYFLPSTPVEFADHPCLSEQLKEIRCKMAEIELLAGLPSPTRGDDVLWRRTKYEYPVDGEIVMLCLRLHCAVVAGGHEDGRWIYSDGTEIEDQTSIYAWAEMPRPLAQKRKALGLLLLPWTQGGAS